MVKKFDPEGVLDIIQQERITRFFIVPTMVTALLEHPDSPSYDKSSVKEILIGGAPPPTGMCARVEEAFGCVVHGGFGMSETCPLIALPELPIRSRSGDFSPSCSRDMGIPACGRGIQGGRFRRC